MSAPSLYVAISAHGFGHLAQTAPVVNALAERNPRLRVVVQCVLPSEVLRAHLRVPFDHIDESPDIGMRMVDSLDVLAEETYSAYAELHRDWSRHVQHEARRLREIAPDFVLSNIAYLPLAAAAAAGIPSAALCSLNWAECFLAYCRDYAGADGIHREMIAAYAEAEIFFNPAPSMPMPGLDNLQAVGPIACLGRDRREELHDRLGLQRGVHLVVVSLGGIFTALPIEQWPCSPSIHYIVSSTEVPRRPDMFALDATGMPFIDVLASADAIVTKPGYGTFAEAVCNGVPLLYVRRTVWPEEPYLVNWLREHARCGELSRAQLQTGGFHANLEALWNAAARPKVKPAGVHDIVSALAPRLSDAEEP